EAAYADAVRDPAPGGNGGVSYDGAAAIGDVDADRVERHGIVVLDGHRIDDRRVTRDDGAARSAGGDEGVIFSGPPQGEGRRQAQLLIWEVVIARLKVEQPAVGAGGQGCHRREEPRAARIAV